MKLPKFTVLTAAVLVALASFGSLSSAQQSDDNAGRDRPAAGQRERGPGGPAGANAFNRIGEQLKLTDEQKTKLQPIFREELSKLRELRQDTSLTPEQRREKTRTIRQEYLAKMKPVLKPDQFEQLTKMRESAAARGARGDRPDRGGQRQREGGGERQP